MDTATATAIRYGVSSIPTLLWFRDGEVVKKLVGYSGEAELREVTDAPLDEEALKSAIAATGYTVTGIRTEPYEKKHFTLFKH